MTAPRGEPLMPSERTRELIAAVIDARIDYEKTPASRPVLVAQRRVKYKDADRALLSHYAEIERERDECLSWTPEDAADLNSLTAQLATANEEREAVTEKLEAAQMHNYRQNERIAKMQAVSIQFRSEIEGGYAALAAIKDSDIVKRSPSLRTFEKWCAALDALPSTTEDTGDALSV